MKQPDEKWLQKTMKSLSLTKEEALELWACDNDELEDEEQEELDRKAKAVKIDHGAVAEGRENKKRKAPVRKPNEVKQALIAILAEALSQTDVEGVTVTNAEKYIDFTFGGKQYTVNLVEHRPKKGEA